MASWYERVSDLLGDPGAPVHLDGAVDARGEGGFGDGVFGDDLAPEDIDLLLRAATDLLPPSAALELSARLDEGAEPALPDSWVALVTGTEPWELTPEDLDGPSFAEDGAHPSLGLPVEGVDLDFGRGAPTDSDEVGDEPVAASAADLLGPAGPPAHGDLDLGLQVDLGGLGDDHPFTVGGPDGDVLDDVDRDDEDPDDGSWHDGEQHPHPWD